MTAQTTSIRIRWIRAVTSILIVIAALAALVAWNPTGAYPWLKAFHIIAVIAWMAGMLYLPRLFVYHCEAEPGSVQSETFKVMERRLLRAIINPSMMAAWTFGLFMVYVGGLIAEHWLWLKLSLVVALSGIHGLLVRCTHDFAMDRNPHSQRFYRIVNEIPAVLMIGIVILVVIKPF